VVVYNDFLINEEFLPLFFKEREIKRVSLINDSILKIDSQGRIHPLKN